MITVQGGLSAPRGVHDDAVDSLAMAVKLWRNKKAFTGDAIPIVLPKSPGWVIT